MLHLVQASSSCRRTHTVSMKQCYEAEPENWCLSSLQLSRIQCCSGKGPIASGPPVQSSEYTRAASGLMDILQQETCHECHLVVIYSGTEI